MLSVRWWYTRFGGCPDGASGVVTLAVNPGRWWLLVPGYQCVECGMCGGIKCVSGSSFKSQFIPALDGEPPPLPSSSSSLAAAAKKWTIELTGVRHKKVKERERENHLTIS